MWKVSRLHSARLFPQLTSLFSSAVFAARGLHDPHHFKEGNTKTQAFQEEPTPAE